jgi:hypothetical protein
MKQNNVVSEDILVFRRKVWTDSRNRKTLVIPRKVAIYLGLKPNDILLYKMDGPELQLLRPQDVDSDNGYTKVSLFKTNGDTGIYPVGLYYPEEAINNWNLEEGERVTVEFSFKDTVIRVLPKWVHKAKQEFIEDIEHEEKIVALGEKMQKYYVEPGFVVEKEGFFIPLQ